MRPMNDLGHVQPSPSQGGARARPQAAAARSGRARRRLPARAAAARPRDPLHRRRRRVGAWHYVSPQIEAILGFTPQEWCADPNCGRAACTPTTASGCSQPRAGSSTAQPSRRRGRVPPAATATVTSSGCATTRCWCSTRTASRRWHGVMSDITEHKQAEAELERRAAQQAAVARLGEHALEGASTLGPDAGGGRAPRPSCSRSRSRAVLELLPERRRVRVPRHARAAGARASATGCRPAQRSQAGYTILTRRAGGRRRLGSTSAASAAPRSSPRTACAAG